MASPHRNEEDFIAFKKGELRNLRDKHNSRKRHLEFRKKIDGEIMISDEELKNYVDDIIRKDLRRSSYETLLKAKNSKKAISDFYNFVNAYKLNNDDDSYGTVACMAIDTAEAMLKKKYNPSKKKQITLP